MVLHQQQHLHLCLLMELLQGVAVRRLCFALLPLLLRWCRLCWRPLPQLLLHLPLPECQKPLLVAQVTCLES